MSVVKPARSEILLGSHIRFKAPDYFLGAVQEALSYGENTFMIYTGAPQNTVRKPLAELKIQEGQALLKEHHIPLERVIVHAPYLINIAQKEMDKEDFPTSFLASEIARTHALGAKCLVLHPGAYTDRDLETALRAAANRLNRLNIPEGVVICLETMAGKGTEIGRRFEELAELLSLLKKPEHFGICLDTCHVHDAGYDVTSFDTLLDTFDHVLGLERLLVIHLNDSRNPRGSHKDRHANIGSGTIGFKALRAAAVNPRTARVPKILETPYIDGKPPYKDEIAWLKSGRKPKKKAEP